MRVDKLERSTITGYLKLDKTIQNMQERIQSMENDFYHAHSFMSSPNAVDSNGNATSNQNGYRLVNQLIETEQNTLFDIKVCRYKQYQFSRYIHQLTTDDRAYLQQFFLFNTGSSNNQLNERTLAEIGQIEESTAWRFGLEQDIHIEAVQDATVSITNMLNLFKVM